MRAWHSVAFVCRMNRKISYIIIGYFVFAGPCSQLLELLHAHQLRRTHCGTHSNLATRPRHLLSSLQSFFCPSYSAHFCTYNRRRRLCRFSSAFWRGPTQLKPYDKRNNERETSIDNRNIWHVRERMNTQVREVAQALILWLWRTTVPRQYARWTHVRTHNPYLST